MRLAHADRHPAPRQPRNGNRLWLVTCVVTVVVLVFVAVKLTGSGCPAAPRAGGPVAAAGAGGATDSAGRGGPAGPAGTGLLAARPAVARSVIDGHAVFYDPGQASGSCELGPFPAGGWYASLPPRGYASGRACGSYLDVYGPSGTVRAEVVDVCTDCAAGTVDLSRAAFARIASPRRGTVAVSYQAAVNPPLPGPLTLRITAAERTGTLAVQVINHGNRLSSVAARRPGGRWERLVPGADGYWTGPLRPGRPGTGPATGGTAAALAGGGTGPAPRGRVSVRVTDVAGHRVLLTGISLRSAVLHASAWMYRARRQPAGQGTRAPAAAPAQASRAGPAASTGSC